jgi:hypothetical protein
MRLIQRLVLAVLLLFSYALWNAPRVVSATPCAAQTSSPTTGPLVNTGLNCDANGNLLTNAAAAGATAAPAVNFTPISAPVTTAQIMGQFNTAALSGTSGLLAPLQLDLLGNLKVNVVSQGVNAYPFGQANGQQTAANSGVGIEVWNGTTGVDAVTDKNLTGAMDVWVNNPALPTATPAANQTPVATQYINAQNLCQYNSSGLSLTVAGSDAPQQCDSFGNLKVLVNNTPAPLVTPSPGATFAPGSLVVTEPLNPTSPQPISAPSTLPVTLQALAYDPCLTNVPAIADGTTTTAGPNVLIAASTGKRIYACSELFVALGTTTFTITEGTAGACTPVISTPINARPASAYSGDGLVAGLGPSLWFTSAVSNEACLAQPAVVGLYYHIVYVYA